MSELLFKRKSKLPKECLSHYADGKNPNKEEELCRFLATTGKYPWGACVQHIHKLTFINTGINTSGTSSTFTTFSLKDQHINFLTGSHIVLSPSAKLVKCALKIDKDKIIQQIDSWFANEIITRYKKLSSSSNLKRTIRSLPFYYNDNLARALPLSLLGTPPIQFEFEIENLSSTDEVKLINEYASSDLDSYTADESTLHSLYQQYVPHFISTVNIPVTSSITEVTLNSNNKVIKSLYFRVYNSKCNDIQNVKRINLAGEDIPEELWTEYYKNKFSTSIDLPYYVLSFCPNPKSDMPEYGEVFKDDKLIIELESSPNPLGDDKATSHADDFYYLIDVTLETVNEITWMTREM